MMNSFSPFFFGILLCLSSAVVAILGLEMLIDCRYHRVETLTHLISQQTHNRILNSCIFIFILVLVQLQKPYSESANLPRLIIFHISGDKNGACD